MVLKIKLFLKIINLKTKFQFNKCNLWEENEQKLWWTDQPTDRQTAVKQYALPSMRGGGVIIKTHTTYDVKQYFNECIM